MNKMNFSLSAEGFRAVLSSLQMCSIGLNMEPCNATRKMMEQLLLHVGIRMHSRTWNLKKKNTLILTIPEAMAFYLVMGIVVEAIREEYAQVVVQDMVDKIHKSIV